jgi:hypothetical protein
MPVNEMILQTPGNTISQSWGGGGLCETNKPSEVVEIATLYEFFENDRFFTTPWDPYMGPTLRLFYTFHHKNDTKMAFQKNA